MTTNRINTAILGASGYTGAELLRLLARHPKAHVKALTADKRDLKRMPSSTFSTMLR